MGSEMCIRDRLSAFRILYSASAVAGTGGGYRSVHAGFRAIFRGKNEEEGARGSSGLHGMLETLRLAWKCPGIAKRGGTEYRDRGRGAVDGG